MSLKSIQKTKGFICVSMISYWIIELSTKTQPTIIIYKYCDPEFQKQLPVNLQKIKQLCCMVHLTHLFSTLVYLGYCTNVTIFFITRFGGLKTNNFEICF